VHGSFYKWESKFTNWALSYPCCAWPLTVTKKKNKYLVDAKRNYVQSSNFTHLTYFLLWSEGTQYDSGPKRSLTKKRESTQRRDEGKHPMDRTFNKVAWRKYKLSLLHGPLGVTPIESGDEIAINPLNWFERIYFPLKLKKEEPLLHSKQVYYKSLPCFDDEKKNINLRLLSISLNKTNENIPQKRRHKLIARTNCFLRVRRWLRGTQNLVQSLHTGEHDRVLKRHPIIPRIIKYSDAHFCTTCHSGIVDRNWMNWFCLTDSTSAISTQLSANCLFPLPLRTWFISQGNAMCEKKFKQKGKTYYEWYFGCYWDGQNQDSSSMECSPFDKACSG